MIRRISSLLLCSVLLVSCSKRERSDPDAAEWAEIEALADDAVVVPVAGNSQTNVVPTIGNVAPGEFEPFIQRLTAMKSIKRKTGETLLTGESLVWDHDKRFVRMDQDVVVEDDQGVLKTESLVGRYSISNEFEFVEAQGGVELVSSNRTASADAAIYNYRNGFIQLEGKGNRRGGRKSPFRGADSSMG